MNTVSPPAMVASSASDIEKPLESTSSHTSSPSSATLGDATHRRLRSRHIQLIGIGGSIGTALYVQIGKGLYQGGPASLFIAFTFWCLVILCVTVSMAEMVSYLPISSPFIRFAGRWVDEAFGFAAGWNFFVFQAAMVPFEVTACNVILRFWTDAIPVWAVIVIVLFIYAAINLTAVKWYGEFEFWAALGKVLLIIGLIFFTFIVMLGGNPLHDRFGFRNWRDPGSFAEYYATGSLGRFMGFVQCLIQAAFTIAGPEYVSMAAGEAENPRVVMPRAYSTVFYRLTTFFMLGSLAVGILVPYNDPTMREAFELDKPGAAASPYVVAMDNLRVSVLPHIVNAMVLTSALSAGNSYVYCASRSLFGLALEGKAPRALTRCLANGVPIYSVAVVLVISLLAFLQVSSSAGTVLNWFVSLVTASQLINFGVMCVTYLCFYRALQAQGVDRRALPFRGLCQPYAAWFGLVCTSVMAFVGGYNVFLPGKWKATDFVFSYTMIIVCPILYIIWKVVHRTKPPSAMDRDIKRDVADIDEYQANYIPRASESRFERVLDKLLG
jgi:amino acid transporter